MAYLFSILARVFALDDAILSNWTTGVAIVADPTGCGLSVLNVSLNSCGQSLADALANHRIVEAASELLMRAVAFAGHY